MKNKKYIEAKTKQLNKTINKIYNDYFEKVSKLLISYYNENKTYKEFSEGVIDIIYEMLQEIYSTTSTAVKNIYKIKDLPLSKIQPFDADGKTLEDRIYIWFSKKSSNYILDKEAALKQLDVIVKTEAKHQQQLVMYDKLNGLAEFAIVVSGGGDCKESICDEYEGEWPIGELIWPPYHPNCNCYVIYEVTDDPQEIEDLDLQDDIDEEE